MGLIMVPGAMATYKPPAASNEEMSALWKPILALAGSAAALLIVVAVLTFFSCRFDDCQLDELCDACW